MRFFDQEQNPRITAVLSTHDEPAGEVAMRGRVWFSAVAGITLVIIFAIILLLVVADFMDIIKLADLIPFFSD
jgi:hypothetical protein